MFDLRPPSDALSSCDAALQKSGVLCNSARSDAMSTRVCWISRSGSLLDVKVCFWRRSIQGTPEGAIEALGRALRNVPRGRVSRRSPDGFITDPAFSSTPHDSTGLYVECSAMCGAATMFSKPFVSTRARHKNSRRRKSNAPTSAVLDASSRFARSPNSAIPKYAMPSITVRPFMNVLSSSVQSTSNAPRASGPASGAGGVYRHSCPSPELRMTKPPPTARGRAPCRPRPESRARARPSPGPAAPASRARGCAAAPTPSVGSQGRPRAPAC